MKDFREYYNKNNTQEKKNDKKENKKKLMDQIKNMQKISFRLEENYGK